MAFDGAGNLYFSENGNEVIRKITTTGIISTVAGGGTSGLGDGGPATNAGIYHPLGVAIDNAGNVYFADAGDHRIRKINTSGIISTFAGGGTSLGDDGPATSAYLNIAGFIAFDKSGALYIPDWADHRVRKVSTSGIITTVAGNGINIDNGDGLSATAASIMSPYVITFDESGNYYISNYVSCVVRKVNASGIISTVVGNGTCGFSGDTGPATAAEINPTANCSYVDASGNIYIADSKNNRIRRVTYDATVVNAVKEMQQSLSIYPNPAHEKITMTAGWIIEKVEVMNMIGQSFSEKLTMTGQRKMQINVSDLPNGIYFVKVNGVYGVRFVKE